MSKIIVYAPEQIRTMTKNVERSYEQNLTQMLTFEDWKCNAFPILKEHPMDFGVQTVDFSKPIGVCPSCEDMLAIYQEHQDEYDDIKMHAKDTEKDVLMTKLSKKLFTPKQVIHKPEGFFITGKNKMGEREVPIWFNSTLRGINLRLGYANMDSATPGAMRLDDDCVHGMLGGATGAGKSVALNTIISSCLLEYAPWELELYLVDMKITELIRYANRIKTPHIAMVGATSSTEFVMSLFNKLKREMQMRQEIFEICGVENIKNFREKFNLVMPRVVLIVDEFVQLYSNLKDAEQEGCTDTDDQRTAINSSISAIARLGRSMGIHMLLSSQSLEGTLDDQTTNQFKAGASLYASSSVSKALIGNDAGVRITGKGKGIVNQNKFAADEDSNIYTRIPYINSEISEEEAAAGKLPYLQELLADLKVVSDSIGWDNDLYTYNERDIIPYALFTEDVKIGDKRETEPNTGGQITDQIFKEEITKVITMGRPVRYSREGVATIDLKTRRNHSVMVAALNQEDREYMLRLLIENLKSAKFKHYVVVGDKAIVDITGIESKLERASTLRAKCLPAEVSGIVANRKLLLATYTSLQDFCDGKWNLEYVLTQQTQGIRMSAGGQKLIAQAAEKRWNAQGEAEQAESLANLNQAIKQAGVDDYYYDKVIDALSRTHSLQKMLDALTKGYTVPVNANSFERVFVWFMGIDEHMDLMDPEIFKRYKDLLATGPTVGVHSILTGEHWTRTGMLAESCSFVLEKCTKQFFQDCTLPVKVNINKNSLQLLDQERKISEIIRRYKIR